MIPPYKKKISMLIVIHTFGKNKRQLLYHAREYFCFLRGHFYNCALWQLDCLTYVYDFFFAACMLISPLILRESWKYNLND